MLQYRLASKEDKTYFIEDYLKYYGKEQDLAERYAIACTEVHRSLMIYKDEENIGAITWTMKEGITSGLVEIFQMSIPNKKNRRKGYGNTLLLLCIEDIENYYRKKGYPLRRVFIVIDEENLAGRNVYRKNGFDVLLEVKHHLKTGHKAFVYAKDYF
ncbi:GNAT family N-acetyltransferase [Natronincola ferrireducens]|uniref:Acetyltransferase (GNAT) domain-containing protein n=1 Tax=Natronincola ferrireducens TaxID=393762 RepID=A0A1G8YRH3_9FIRM|nr:GNAT family N-acetyltransferase [Natronincola ferrireducens]SDK04630.1 Acetyltransferase (GNAT) domain-containing protein [Natronincola ferrireducens]